MIYIDLPTISQGTTEQQLAEIRSYIYKSNEQMNATLANLTVDKIWEQTANALSASGNSKGETDKLVSQYQKVRDLIIKTADVVIQTDEQMKMAMSGSFLAKSQFGEYLLNTSVKIDGTSTGFTQLYTYSSQLGSDYNNYKVYQQNFIKEGLLDDSEGIPVYGVEIGLLTSEFDVEENGEITTVTVDNNKKMRVTPTELSLWDSDIKVAYITEGAVYFPQAQITGGSININNKFIVDSEGNLTAKSGEFAGNININDNFIVDVNGVMTAKKGTFSGTITAETLKSAFNSVYESVQLNNNRLEIYALSLQTTLDKSGLSLYEGSNCVGYYGKSNIGNGNNYNYGITISLDEIGKFFTVRNFSNQIVFGYSSGNCLFGNEEEGLYFMTDSIFVRSDSSHYMQGWTGTKNIVTNITDNGGGSISWINNTLTVVNGLIVGF